MGSDFYSLVEPYYKAPAIPETTGYHMYSYSLDCANLDPMGSTNFGKLTNVGLRICPSAQAVAAGAPRERAAKGLRDRRARVWFRSRDDRARALRDLDDARAAADALYRSHPPALLISIERPGSAADGRCYNMAGVDITARCGGAEPYLVQANCPTIAIGDGGNELGMGNVLNSLSKLNIQPSVSTCDELVVADVSNWAAYALCAVARWLSDPEYSAEHRIREDLEYLVARGAVDGVTGEATPTEDSFPAAEGERLTQAVYDTRISGEWA